MLMVYDLIRSIEETYIISKRLSFQPILCRHHIGIFGLIT